MIAFDRGDYNCKGIVRLCVMNKSGGEKQSEGDELIVR